MLKGKEVDRYKDTSQEHNCKHRPARTAKVKRGRKRQTDRQTDRQTYRTLALSPLTRIWEAEAVFLGPNKPSNRPISSEPALLCLTMCLEAGLNGQHAKEMRKKSHETF